MTGEIEMPRLFLAFDTDVLSCPKGSKSLLVSQSISKPFVLRRLILTVTDACTAEDVARTVGVEMVKAGKRVVLNVMGSVPAVTFGAHAWSLLIPGRVPCEIEERIEVQVIRTTPTVNTSVLAATALGVRPRKRPRLADVCPFCDCDDDNCVCAPGPKLGPR